MDEPKGDEGRARPAFAIDAVGQRARAAVKAAWWTAAGGLARSITRPTKGRQAQRFTPSTAPPATASLRRAYLEAFEKDARDVAAGLYPAGDAGLTRPSAALREAADFVIDALEVDQRRRRGDGERRRGDGERRRGDRERERERDRATGDRERDEEGDARFRFFFSFFRLFFSAFLAFFAALRTARFCSYAVNSSLREARNRFIAKGFCRTFCSLSLF